MVNIKGMKAKIKRIDKSLPLPEYKTPGAAALDCAARETTIAEPGKLTLVPLNICIKPPKNHYVMLAARSSLPKKGLMLANGIGIGDEDFSGNKDEYRAAIYNFTDKPVTIERGDRIAQIIFRPYEKIEWEEVENLEGESRGGFGSTGV